MRINLRIAILVCVVLFFLHGSIQAQERLYVTAEAGDYAPVGFKLPHLYFGFRSETNEGRLFETDAEFGVSPDVKDFSDRGVSISAKVSQCFWVLAHLAGCGSIGGSNYWSAAPTGAFTTAPNGLQYDVLAPFSKGGFTPSFGIMVRDSLFRRAGRLILSYNIPTGCEWATASNPCTVQSSRTQGVVGSQEFEIWHRVLLGISAAWVRYADQSNQNDPAAGRTWHDQYTVAGTFKYQFHGKPR